MPRQLPLAARGFVGRAKHLAELDALLQADSVVISALDGTAGIGKTTLAVHWAHRVQHHFPDGTLHTNLRGYGPGDPATPAEVLDEFLLALGMPPERIPAGTNAKAALFRSVLTGKRVLIVLDNANAVNQVRPLLPGSPGCLVLITSRASLTGLVVNDGANRVTLDLLTLEEAIGLVREILGSRADTEPDAVADLIRLCAHLPLALRIAAGRAATQPHLGISELAADIADNRWEALTLRGDEDTAVRAVFDWSYRKLSIEHARAFRHLGLHPGPDMSLHAAAAVTGLPLTHARKALDALADVHLVEPISANRYRLHDLLRAYAADHANQDDDRDEARRAVLEWYAHHAIAAVINFNRALDGDWYPGFAARKRVTPELTFNRPADSNAWVETEHANLVSCAHEAERHQMPELTAIIAYSAGQSLGRLGYQDDMVQMSNLGLAATRRANDRVGEAYALVQHCDTRNLAFHWREAIESGRAALAMARQMRLVHLEAAALNGLGLGYFGEGEYAEAERYLTMALPLSVGVQRGRFEAVVEGNLSRVHCALGDFERALHHAQRSLSLRRQVGDLPGEASTLNSMAMAYQGMGSHVKAVELCELSLHVDPDTRYPVEIAHTLDTMGRSLLHNGEFLRAAEGWREALHIFETYADPRADELRQRLNDMREPPSGPGR